MGKEQLDKSESIFVELGNGEIRAYSMVNLEERFKVACNKVCKEANHSITAMTTFSCGN